MVAGPWIASCPVLPQKPTSTTFYSFFCIINGSLLLSHDSMDQDDWVSAVASACTVRLVLQCLDMP